MFSKNLIVSSLKFLTFECLTSGLCCFFQHKIFVIDTHFSAPYYSTFQVFRNYLYNHCFAIHGFQCKGNWTWLFLQQQQQQQKNRKQISEPGYWPSLG